MLQVLLLLVVIVFTLILFRRRAETQNFPPGPLCLPWIGSAYVMGINTSHMHVILTALAKKWGPIYRLKVGPTPIVVISDPSIIREAFHGISAPVTLRFICTTIRQTDKGISMLFSDNRSQWGLMRKLHQPITRNKADGTPVSQVIKEELAKLIAAMDKYVNQEVYLNPLFLFFTRNVFLHLALSKSWSFDTENQEEKDFTTAMFETVDNASSIADFIPSLDFLATKSRKITVDNCKKIDNLMKKEIMRREADANREANPHDLIDLLMLECKENPEVKEAVLVTFHNMIFAGSVTTSDSLDWLTLYLCAHPDLQEKCYKEISEKLKGRQPTAEDQAELPFLDAILKETLRLRPPVPLSLPHVADQDCTISGYHIEKGTVVMQNLYGIGNLEKYFPNHSVFDPERWLRQPDLASNLLTFGHGPTMCLGMPIAKQEFFLAAASLLQRFEFKIGPSTPSPDFTGEFKLTFNPKPWKTHISLRT